MVSSVTDVPNVLVLFHVTCLLIFYVNIEISMFLSFEGTSNTSVSWFTHCRVDKKKEKITSQHLAWWLKCSQRDISLEAAEKPGDMIPTKSNYNYALKKHCLCGMTPVKYRNRNITCTFDFSWCHGWQPVAMDTTWNQYSQFHLSERRRVAEEQRGNFLKFSKLGERITYKSYL